MSTTEVHKTMTGGPAPYSPMRVIHGLSHKVSDEYSIPHSLVATADGHTLRFSDSGRVSRKRTETLLTKEPTTVAWLGTFDPLDVLVDVGANVGTYSVFAAAVTKCRVYAFEPEALNYAELMKNLVMNQLTRRVTAYCMALSDNQEGVSLLYLSRFQPAYSHHDAVENLFEGPVTGMVASPADRIRQGCVTDQLDRLVNAGEIDTPTHLKIDVDGLEERVLGGAEHVLRDPGLKTVLIELDFHREASGQLMTRMLHEGWRYSLDQVCVTREGRLTDTEWHKRVNDGRMVCNVIFYRAGDDRYPDLFRRTAEGVPYIN